MEIYLYCGRAQAKITNVIPMDPAKAKLTKLFSIIIGRRKLVRKYMKFIYIWDNTFHLQHLWNRTNIDAYAI